MKHYESLDFSVEISGEVAILNSNLSRATIKEAKDFKEHLEKIKDSNIKKVVINFSETDFVDSSIIGAMVLANKEFQKIGGAMCVVTQPAGINNIFAAAGLNRIFNIFNSVEYAVNTLQELK